MRQSSSTQLVGRRLIVRIIAVIVVIGMLVYTYVQQQQREARRRGADVPPTAEAPLSEAPPVDAPIADREDAETARPEAPPTEAPKRSPKNSKIVANQTIRDLEGEVVYRGDIDLTETLARIEAGRRLSYSNDGSVFQNRERRLPREAPGYYREYVHPTDDLDGPGPQRIVTGEGGEIYYTPDHYRTFRRIDAR